MERASGTWAELTLDELIERLTQLRAAEGHGDLPVALEDDRGARTVIQDIWLYWDDAAEVETPVRWLVNLT